MSNMHAQGHRVHDSSSCSSCSPCVQDGPYVMLTWRVSLGFVGRLYNIQVGHCSHFSQVGMGCSRVAGHRAVERVPSCGATITGTTEKVVPVEQCPRVLSRGKPGWAGHAGPGGDAKPRGGGSDEGREATRPSHCHLPMLMLS